MNQAPNIADITALVRQVFKPERFKEIALHGWHLTIHIRTDRHQRVTLPEVVRLAELLGVGAENVEFWDVKTNGGGIELSIDIDPTTPLEIPRRLL